MGAGITPASAEAFRRFATAFEPELVGRNCRRLSYDKRRRLRSFEVDGEIIAYSSPDSTYAVTKRLLEAAQRSIVIGIYDFVADYMKELLLRQMRRGVAVTLKLDLDGRSGEEPIFDDLIAHGCRGVAAPSCASRSGARYFSSSHEKVIVVDGEWTLVQSGNYSEASIPDNEADGTVTENFVPGNRDMGVAIRDRPLARFFSDLIEADIRLEEQGAPEALRAPEPGVLLMEAAPAKRPARLFPSKRFAPQRPVRVMPILSPENYMLDVPPVLERAERSIRIEQQYIRGGQPAVASLLAKIREAMDRRRSLDVQIILAMPKTFASSWDKEVKAIRQLERDFALGLGKHVRILSPERFIHCHNKLIIVDEKVALVSSQNWSDSSLTLNREAGLLIEYPPLARHLARMFKSDWDTAFRVLPSRTKAKELLAPESFGAGKVVELNWGDYAEV